MICICFWLIQFMSFFSSCYLFLETGFFYFFRSAWCWEWISKHFTFPEFNSFFFSTKHCKLFLTILLSHLFLLPFLPPSLHMNFSFQKPIFNYFDLWHYVGTVAFRFPHRKLFQIGLALKSYFLKTLPRYTSRGCWGKSEFDQDIPP